MRIPKSITIVLALLISLSLLLAACAPQAAPAPADPQATQGSKEESAQAPAAQSGEPVKLVIWTAYGTQLAPAVEAYNQKMKDEGKNVEVTGTELTFDSISDKFGVALSTGDVPDILDIDLVLAPMFTSKGAFLDITEQVKAAELDKDFNPKFLDLGVWDGKIYMIPFSADVSVLFYNQDIFKKAGLDPEKPPQTWEDLRAALLKIRDADLKNDSGQPVYAYASASGAGSKMFCDMPYLWTNGGNWLDDKGNIILDSPESIAGMKFLADMYNVDKLVPPNPTSYSWDDKMNMFYSGQVAVMCSGSYALAEVKDRAPDLNYNTFLFRIRRAKGIPAPSSAAT